MKQLLRNPGCVTNFFLPLIRSLIIDYYNKLLVLWASSGIISNLCFYIQLPCFFPSIRKKNVCTFGQHFVHPAASVNTILIPVCV